MVVIVLAAMHKNGINIRSTPQEQFAGMRKLKHYCKNPKLFSLCIFFFNEICNDPPLMTQYCPLLSLPNQTSHEVTHPGIALAEARLTAEF
jgi:hypothetical protein